MSIRPYGGGTQVLASTLAVGDVIRDPRKVDRTMIVLETGSQIIVRGYEKSETNKHRFLDPNQTVIKVTNANTDTTLGVS